MHGGKVEALGDLVVAADATVFRQQRLDVETVEREEVFERVYVFAAGHPPHAGPARPVDPRRVGPEKLRIEPAGDRGDFVGGRPCRLGRRHLPLGDTVVDADEPTQRVGV